ncbi:MAG TPA: hypothetical protein PKY96_03420 [Flavobacteriales bacterium]|nr:hypothetical protein [Flavobacteriales bacterium]
MKRSLLLGLAITAFSLALHFAPVWENMLNRGAETWDEQPLPYDYIETVIAAHSDGSDPAFVRRPWTTISIGALTAIGLTPKQAFIAVGLTGFFIAGVLVFLIAMRLGIGEHDALWSQALFQLSPTVLCAWFDPLYTYDEPIQYAAVLAALLALLHQRWFVFVPALLLALMARETSLLLLPAFFQIAPKRKLTIIATLVSVALFAAWLLISPQGTSAADLSADLARRADYLTINFSAERIGETIGFMALVLALPLFLFFRQRASVARPWRSAFIIVLLLNVPLVLAGAFAREARLFALPLVMLWPFLGAALHAELTRHGGWHGLLQTFRSPVAALALIAISALVIIGAYTGFTLTAGWQQDNPFHELLIAQLIFIAACMIASRRRVA